MIEKYSEEYGHQLKHLLNEAKSLKNGFSVLDVGAGSGKFAVSFLKKSKKKASSYTAIEPSEKHVEMLRKNTALLNAEDLVRLLSYKTDKGVKLNFSVAAITITK